MRGWGLARFRFFLVVRHPELGSAAANPTKTKVLMFRQVLLAFWGLVGFRKGNFSGIRSSGSLLVALTVDRT